MQMSAFYVPSTEKEYPRQMPLRLLEEYRHQKPFAHGLLPQDHAANALHESHKSVVSRVRALNTLLHRRMAEQERNTLSIMRSPTSLRQPIVKSSVAFLWRL